MTIGLSDESVVQILRTKLKTQQTDIPYFAIHSSCEEQTNSGKYKIKTSRRCIFNVLDYCVMFSFYIFLNWFVL